MNSTFNLFVFVIMVKRLVHNRLMVLSLSHGLGGVQRVRLGPFSSSLVGIPER